MWSKKFLLVLVGLTKVEAFMLPGAAQLSKASLSTARKMSAAPTLEELAKDPFMKQVSHASTIVELLEDNKEENQDELKRMLTTQLGHSDGIRGFFVTYLTGETSPADDPVVPSVLKEAMTQVDPKELVPLACMNAIMPTAMITMHEDPNLSEQSRKTSERGIRILAAISDCKKVQENCEAVLAAATDSFKGEAKLVEYWNDFFDKWGYKEEQKKDIVNAVTAVLES